MGYGGTPRQYVQRGGADQHDNCADNRDILGRNGDATVDAGEGGDGAAHGGGEGLPQVSWHWRNVLQGLLWKGQHQYLHHHYHQFS